MKKSNKPSSTSTNRSKSFTKIEELLNKAESFTGALLNPSKKPSKVIPKPRSQRRRGNFDDERIEEKEIVTEAKVHRDYLFSQPSILKNGKLKDFQLTGLNWLISLYNNEANGILADEMGLGKTIQTISMLAYLVEYKGIKGPFIIITPKTTIPNWLRELKKWLPELNSVFLSGIKQEIAENEEIIRRRKFDVVITTYEGVKKNYMLFRKILWEYMVIDEGQKIKNEESLLSLVVRDFMCKKKLLLSGTPLQNNIHELWSLLNFLMPDVFDSSELFDNWFDAAGEAEAKGLSNEEMERVNSELLLKLHRVIKPFILRRVKTEVEKSLPPKKEIYIYVGVTELQRKMYIDMLKQRAVISKDSSKSTYMNLAMQLKKICNHPYLFESIEDDENPLYGDHLITVCGKMMVLDKLLKKLHSESHQVLLFSQMTSLLDIIEDYCVYRKFTFCRIDGSTSLEDRESQMQEFTKENSPIFLFLLSTRAGGLGINLYTADTVILYDSDWNPQMDLQAMDRAHRIGQKNIVKVYRLLTKGTIEERLNERQLIKLKWDSLIVRGNHSQGKNFSKEDLRNLIDFGVSDIFHSEGGTYTDEDIELILKKGEEQAIEKEKKVQEHLEKHKNLFDLGREDVEHSLYDFDDVDYKQHRVEDLKALNNIKLKALERADSSVKKRRVLARVEEDEDGKLESLDLDEILKLASTRKKAEKKYPTWHLYDERERLLELETKRQAYLLYNRKPEIKREEDSMLCLTSEERKEIETLEATGFRDWSKKDELSLFKALDIYERKNCKAIAEFIGTKREEEVEKYIHRLFKVLENHPYKSRIEASIKKVQEKIEAKRQTENLVDFYEIIWKNKVF